MEPNVYRCCWCGAETYEQVGWIELREDDSIEVAGREKGPWLFCTVRCLLPWVHRWWQLGRPISLGFDEREGGCACDHA